MFGQVWNHGTIRKYVIYFGTLFNEVILTRDDASGNIIQYMKVPLNYGPKEKYLARLEGNPDLNRPVALTLPRMSFEMTNMQYDHERKLSTTGKVRTAYAANTSQLKYQYNPVPYNIDFNLYIMVKNAEDGTRIIEQILPFFTPEWTASLKINPDMGLNYDVPIILNSVRSQDTYEGSFETRRAIIWTLSFTMKALVFGPAKTGSIIKQAEVNIMSPNMMSINEYIAAGNNIPVVEITILPGLTANGQPTSDITQSVDKSEIESTDNYGFIIDIQENI